MNDVNPIRRFWPRWTARASRLGPVRVKSAIASIEIFAHRDDSPVRRLTFVIGAPEPSSSGADWTCRVALADLHRPEALLADDSASVLGQALARGRAWLTRLEDDGYSLSRDRAGREPYCPDSLIPGASEPD